MPGPLPQKLANFEIEGQLGAGGMAEVFLAKKRGAEGTYKRLVVKRILETHGASQRFHSMFAEEAQLATRLNHPNIVQVYDFQDYGAEGHLLSMEYVEGPDLRKLMRAARTKNRRISAFIAAYIVSEVARGLHYAHDRRDEDGSPLEIVHRDVSPQNILLSYDGAVKVADFGIATANLFRQETGVLKGKTAYMSPEQARAEKVDRRSDIYSLGVVFHELLTGKPLHGNLEGRELLEAVRAGAVEPPNLFATGIPQELETIVMRAVERDRERRYATAREMSSAITHVLFELHQLVDAETVERTLAEFVEREAPAPQVISKEREESRSHDSRATADSTNSRDADAPAAKARAGREVRHVAIVGLKIHGRHEMEQRLGKAQTSRLADQLRATFDDIAFKHGTRWHWEDAESRDGATAITLGAAIAVIGVGANPSRAATDSAWLAVFIHEAIAGACDGLPVTLRAGVSIVRGVAEGRRDHNGSLVQYTIQPPAELLTRYLCQATRAGATWVAGGIFRLLRRDFVWTDEPSIELTELAVAQLPSSMRVHGLERPLSRAEKRALLAVAPRDLVGRDAELADLHAAYHQCVAAAPNEMPGQAVARLVIGELGVGKTALVTTFLGELPPHARELRSECSPYRTDIPFANAAVWLRELIGVRPEDAAEHVRAAIVEALGPVPLDLTPEAVDRLAELALGQSSEVPDEGEALQQRRLISTGLRVIFGRAARSAPLVVMVDCLQWIDLRSLEFLAMLSRRNDPYPLLLLLVTRPQDRVLSSLEGVVRLELGGLQAENQQRLIEAHLEVISGVREACSDLIPRAGGNPFFLLEMVDALLERGALEISREAGSGKTTLLRNTERAGLEALPSTLEQLIADRLNELPSNERTVVEWLAVAASPLTYADLSELARIPHNELTVIMDALRARGVADPQRDSVDVKHPLIRDVAYMALSVVDRQSMHRRLGAHLAETPRAGGLGAAAVARHLQTGGDSNGAFTYYMKAAEHAHLSHQLALASNYYQRALEALPRRNPRRVAAALALEDISRVLCRGAERKQFLQILVEEAQYSSQVDHAAAAVLRQSQHEFDRGHFIRSLQLAQVASRAALACFNIELQIQAETHLASVLVEVGNAQLAISLATRTVHRAAGGSVATRYVADALVARGNVQVRIGGALSAMSDFAEAIAHFRVLGARRQEARTKTLLAHAAYVVGRYEDSLALAIESVRIDLSLGGRFPVARSLACIAKSYQALGEGEQAQNHFRRAIEAHERGEELECQADTLLCAAGALLGVGRQDNTQREQVQTSLDHASKLCAGLESDYNSVHALLLRAQLSLHAEDFTAALLASANARKHSEAQGYLGLLNLALALEASACAHSGETRLAHLLALECIQRLNQNSAVEFGLSARLLSTETLERVAAPEAATERTATQQYITAAAALIRDSELRKAFLNRLQSNILECA